MDPHHGVSPVEAVTHRFDIGRGVFVWPREEPFNVPLEPSVGMKVMSFEFGLDFIADPVACPDETTRFDDANRDVSIRKVSLLI